MHRTTGVVVAVRPLWRRGSDGRTQRRHRVRVECDEGTVVGGELPAGRTPIKVGDRMNVQIRPGRPPRITPVVAPPEPRGAQVKQGLAIYAGMIVLVLVLAGGIYFAVVSRAGSYLPTGPPASPFSDVDGGGEPSPSGSSPSPGGTPSPGTPSPGGPSPSASGR